MKRIIWFTLNLFFLTMFTASILNAGYRSEPWGSKTWTGPGRPPHWSSPPAVQQKKSTKQVKSRDFRKRVGPDQRVRKAYRPGGKGVFWKDKYNRRNNRHSRGSGSKYYREPRGEEVIIQREKRIPVYTPIQRKPAKQQCGGRTITRNDSKTGEMIVEYVASARDC